MCIVERRITLLLVIFFGSKHIVSALVGVVIVVWFHQVLGVSHCSRVFVCGSYWTRLVLYYVADYIEIRRAWIHTDISTTFLMFSLKEFLTITFR